jgi:hypothetical protein
MMSHKDLVLLQDEESLTSSVVTLVSLRLSGEEQTNGMRNSDRIVKSTKVMMKLRAYVCMIFLSLKVRSHV